MFNYPGMEATARRLLTKFGATATVTRTTITGGSPSDPAAGTPGTSSFTVTCVVIPMPPDMVGMGVGDTVLRNTDVMIYATTGQEPLPNDSIATAAGTYRILDVSELAPAGVNLLYTIAART